MPLSKDMRLAVYGFGSAGQHIVNMLLEAEVQIPFIMDRKKCGGSYRGISIISLKDAENYIISDSETDCLITLHNHYVDMKYIKNEISHIGFRCVYSLARFTQMFQGLGPPNGYWLDGTYDHLAHSESIEAFISLLSDEKSITLARQIVAYRETGDIDLCPSPSEEDEYTPADLPRYVSPLRVIDCGAYTGVALNKLRRSGYEIEAFAAFEPDLANFELLARRDFGAREAICLPLATWSSNEQLRFAAAGSMGSALSDAGETVVQGVRVDDVVRGFAPNLIKLDVEGAETETIKGMRQTIERYRPNLCVSVYHTPTDLFELALTIESWNLDYRFHLRVHEHNTFGVVVYCRQVDLEV